ncbi:hypothetical protein L2E82_29291 [Cichorium intybus]|uniref:Uncharacterized protein n=1 Tax=Cichorium intybus TaxID=13427 RepID=A0ACB9CXR3_CICIN|nr:hypothetical protein L2E82_29291 [Cichorium intybus]
MPKNTFSPLKTKTALSVLSLYPSASADLAVVLMQQALPHILLVGLSSQGSLCFSNDPHRAFPWYEYRYYDPKKLGLDFDGIIDIKAAPEGSFVLLHGCAHNPTTIAPTPQQWEKIADVIQA